MMKDDEANARRIREKWNRCPECNADIRDGREHEDKCSLCGANKEARMSRRKERSMAPDEGMDQARGLARLEKLNEDLIQENEEIMKETAAEKKKVAALHEKVKKLTGEVSGALDEGIRMKRERDALQEKLNGETIATDSKNYRARCWRTEHLKRAAAEDLDAMVHGLLGNHKLRIERGDYEIRGSPYARNHTVMVRVDGWATTGYTREGAMARMLGLMLEGAWYPLT